LSDAETSRKVDLPCLAAVGDQVSDELNVILNQFNAASLAGLSKALNVRIGVHECALVETHLR